MSNDQHKTMFSLVDVIQSFESRIADLVWQIELAQRESKEWKDKYVAAIDLYNNLPFKPIEEVSTNELVKEISRRLNHYHSRDMDDD